MTYLLVMLVVVTVAYVASAVTRVLIRKQYVSVDRYDTRRAVYDALQKSDAAPNSIDVRTNCTIDDDGHKFEILTKTQSRMTASAVLRVLDGILVTALACVASVSMVSLYE